MLADNELVKDMLDEVKAYLAITWQDDDTDKNVSYSIIEGEAFLLGITGASFIDFDKDLEARSLLKDYCRYVRNYSLEEFEINFRSKLIRTQLKYALEEEVTDESEA